MPIATIATPQTSEAPSPSIVVAEFRKNAREVVRASLQTFEGRDVVDIRTFLPRSSDGVLVPTPRGLTLDRRLLPNLEDAVRTARLAVSSGLASRTITSTTTDFGTAR